MGYLLTAKMLASYMDDIIRSSYERIERGWIHRNIAVRPIFNLRQIMPGNGKEGSGVFGRFRKKLPPGGTADSALSGGSGFQTGSRPAPEPMVR